MKSHTPSMSTHRYITTLLIAFVGTLASSHAATVNWIGAAGDSYTNKAAWSTGNLPAPADTAAIGNATTTTGSVVYTNAAPDPAASNILTQLQLGGTASSSGSLSMTAGTLTVTNSGNVMILGNAASASGTFTMSGGSLMLTNSASSTALSLGNANPSTANFTMNGGSLTVVRPSTGGQMFQDSFQVANAQGSTATFTLNNGTATILCGIEIGGGGSGTININGGTFIDNGWFGVGRGGTGTGSKQGFVNITGGTVYILRNPGNEGGYNSVAFCQGATNGVFTMSGGTLFCNAFRFRGSNLTNDWETMNVSGGDIYLGPSGIRDNQDGSGPAAGTHFVSINLSGGTFHSVNMGPNPGGTQGTNSIGPGGTNWAWASDLPATLNTSPGSGTVTFAPDAGKTITLNNQFSGSGALAMTGPGTLVVNSTLNNYSGGTTISGGTVAGTGLVPGPVSVTTGGGFAPGSSTIPGTLTVGSLNLNNSTNLFKLTSDPTTVGSGVNDLIAVNGSVALSGVSTVKIVPLGPLSTTTAYTILTYTGTPLTSADAAHLQVISDSPRYTFTVVDPSTTPGVIKVSVSGNAANLVWKGGVAGNLTSWDHTTTNWLNLATSARDSFFNGDVTIFDDSATTNRATIIGTEQPIAMVTSNNSSAITIDGGALAATLLDMEGTGPLILSSTSAPTALNITNNSGALVFNIANVASYAVTANISDNHNGDFQDFGLANGTLVKANTNTLVLGGNNSGFTGTIVVTNGILQYSNALALGATPAPLYATNGGTLDVAGVVSGLKNIHISGAGYNGQGALINSSSTALINNNGINNITMDGDATVGAVNRWDSYQNSFGGNGYTLTGVGPGSVLLIDDLDIGIGDLHIVAGRIGFQGQVNMGDPTKTCTVESNATLTFFAARNPSTANAGEDKIVVLKGGATFDSGGNAGDSNVFNGPIFMSGTNLIGTRRMLYITNSISDTNGPGGFLLGNDGVGASAEDLHLQGPNTYSGPTIITNRTLFVDAGSSLGSSSLIMPITPGVLNVTALPMLSLGSGQTLQGNGTVAANSVVIGSAARLVPGLGGNNTTALTLNGNLTLQPGSTNVVAVNKTTSVANSKVSSLTNVTIGGALVLNISGNALTASDTIPLFVASGTYSGTFSSISPTTPGTGLAWNTNTLATDGILRILATVNPNPTNLTFNVSGGNLNISWPGDHTGWRLQSQTNTLTSTWYDVPGSTSTNSTSIPIDPAQKAVFYRMIYP